MNTRAGTGYKLRLIPFCSLPPWASSIHTCVICSGEPEHLHSWALSYNCCEGFTSCTSRVYELVVGKQGKKEYPHLDKKSYQPERRLTNGNE